MTKTATPGELITAAQAARILGVDSKTIRRRALAGLLPVAIKLPGFTGAYLFDRAAVEKLAA